MKNIIVSSLLLLLPHTFKNLLDIKPGNTKSAVNVNDPGSQAIGNQIMNAYGLQPLKNKIRRADTSLSLIKVLHIGAKEPVELSIKRAFIHVKAVLGDRRNATGNWEYMLPGDDKIGYVRLTTFGRDSSKEMKETLAKLHEQGIHGLVIDLRNIYRPDEMKAHGFKYVSVGRP